MREFVAFPSIERIQQNVTITEKIHGSNAQVLIEEASTPQEEIDLAARTGIILSGTTYTILAGSRTRWITPEDDNYGFAAWVRENVDALVSVLGVGQHFGEWYGRGINAGYGMKERRFALFNTHRWTPVRDAGQLPAGIDVVPILYAGPFTSTVIDDTLAALKAGGSVLVPGYDKPEGVVVRFDRSAVLMKRTFEAEDAAWTYKKDRPPAPDRAVVEALCAPYWQPVRLEKLLSRDEALGRDYPKSLPSLVSAYVHDLFDETPDVDEATQKLVKKNAFAAIKGMMAERGYAA